MKIGSTARLVQPEVKGEVREKRWNQDADELELLIGWTDASGEEHSRWFLASQLEEVTA